MISVLLFFVRAMLFWVALLAAGFVVYLTLLPSPVPASSVQAEAIVVVTGGSGRVAAGLALLQTDRAPKLFISGVGKGVRLSDVLREAGLASDVGAIDESRISLGHEATNTLENGAEISEWVKEHGVSRIILVSSSYHLPRAQLEAMMASPGLKITAFAVDSEVLRSWWQKQWTVELMLGEYLKTLWVAGQFVGKQISLLAARLVH